MKEALSLLGILLLSTLLTSQDDSDPFDENDDAKKRKNKV
jgi:hypothetical protein